MSRDFYPFDLHTLSTMSDESGRLSTANGEPTPRSNFSTGFESSGFGSGSSVLSSFEPPSDAELLERTRLAQLLDDNRTLPGSLDELQSVISRLQAIYSYRQGLRSAADDMTLNQAMLQAGLTAENGLFAHSGFNAPSYSPPMPSVTGPVWSADDYQLSVAARAVEAAAKEMSAITQQTSQNQLQQEYLTRHAHVGPRPESNIRGYRRKSRRQHSCPVALCAPQWADATWNPRSAVRQSAQSHGTGVFLPANLPNPTTSDSHDESQGSLPGDLHR